MKLLFDLFLTFFKIGAFTFGGGYAMLPLIENDCVDRKKWITHDDMMNVTVIAESTPGPVAINCSTFVGYRQKGIAGAAAATLGVVLPSFIIIYVIAVFLNRFLEIEIIANAFRGMKVCVGILILNAGINMFRKMKKDAVTCTAAACSLVLMLLSQIFAWNVSSLVLMGAGALVGIITCAVRTTAEKARGDK